MNKKKSKSGKKPVKCNVTKENDVHTKRSGSYLRDAFPDDSSDSGLGSDACSSFPESSSSSYIEESDIEWSSDSIDSANSCTHSVSKCKKLNIATPANSSTTPYSRLQIDTNLALTLNSKMQIQNPQTEILYNNSRLMGCLNEQPLAKRRKIMPVADTNDGVSSNPESNDCMKLGKHNQQLMQSPNVPSSNLRILTDSSKCMNLIRKDLRIDELENNEPAESRDSGTWAVKDGHVLRGVAVTAKNGDRIAALLSASNSLTRAKSIKKPSLHVCFPSRSKDGKIELCILIQPEEQHRARYMTEGSRGSIKDDKGTGFPTVKLVGYNQPVVLQVFIGCDQGKVLPHLFYQACKVTGKNCTPCSERVIDGTCVIEINMVPESDMTVSCDCIGILKERNVDVEQRLPYFGLARCKKRSTKCRMIFRVNIPLQNGGYETLQVASSQILCTQSPGLPEICKKSLSECSVRGGSELFIIGKNFQKDAKVIFQKLRDFQSDSDHDKDVIWEVVVDPEKEYIHQSHLVCTVPPYHNVEVARSVKVFLSVLSGGKSSEPHTFTYTPQHPAQGECFETPSLQHPVSTSGSQKFANGITSVGNAVGVNPNISANSESGFVPLLSHRALRDEGSHASNHPASSSLPILPVSMLPQSSKVPMPLSPNSPLENPGVENPFLESGNASFTGMVNLTDPVLINNVSNMDASSHLLSVEEIGCHSNGSLTASSITSSPHVSHSIMPVSNHLLPKDMSDLRSLTSEAAQLELISGIHHLANEMVEAHEKNNGCVVEMMPEVALGGGDFINSSSLNMRNEAELPSLSQHSPKLSHVHEMAAALSPASLPQQECRNPPLCTASHTLPKTECPLPQNGQSSIIMPSFGLLPPDSGTMSSVTAADDGNNHSVTNISEVLDGHLDVKPPTDLLHISDLQSPVIGTPYVTPSETGLNDRLSNCLMPICDQSRVNDNGLVPLLYPSANGEVFHTNSSQMTASNVASSTSLEDVLRSCEDTAFAAATAVEKLLSDTKQQISSPETSVTKPCVKSEKSDQAALNGFQQSMTLALSQLSDADLISMINPSAFDSV